MATKFITTHLDVRGLLTAVDLTQLPFEPKRLFTITGASPGIIRGRHAHKQCRQLLIVVHGIVCVNITKIVKGELQHGCFNLKAGQHIDILPGVWSEQEFVTKGAVLLVCCDRAYEKHDYISDFSEFLAELNY